ncbi:MAG: hypothetical protein ACREOW_15725 [Thermodesulfobacteriota bacterium]
MRKLLFSTLIVAGLISLGGVSSLATIQEDTMQVAAISNVTGKITDIKNDGNTLRIQDLSGKTHSFTVTDPKALQGFKVGDMVRVTMEEGKATSIQKVESAPSKGDAPSKGSSEGAPSNY